MTKYLGDFAAGVSVRGTFQTRAKATGAPITLAGSPALAVYKDGGTTETTTGVALTVDFDSRTGHHLYAITTTDAFYATGSDYRIVLTAGTVDGESQVGVEVGSFSIENRSVPSVSLGTNAPVNWINAAAIATDAITAAKIASNAITDAKIANNAITSAKIAASAIGASQIAANAITDAKINNGAFTAAKFAAGAFDAVWTVATRTLTAISDSSGITTLLSRIASALTITGGKVTVGTNDDKTGYSLTQAFPTNFASLGINPSGHVERVVLVDTTTANTDMRGTDGANTTTPPTVSQVADEVQTRTIARVTLVDTCTTNTDMRGTDSALLASSYTAPANSDVAAIKTKTDQFVFTVANQVDANALSGGGSGLDAAGVRAAIGLASANLDTQLGDIPTNAEFEARTLPSADYFVVGDYTAPDNAGIGDLVSRLTSDRAGYLDKLNVSGTLAHSDAANTYKADVSGLSTFNAASDQVIVATNNDKTGYALTQAFPSNFASLGINSSGHISQVVLVDTTTANTDMVSEPLDSTQTQQAAAAAITAAGLALEATAQSILEDTGTTLPGLIAGIEGGGGGGGLTGDFTLTVTVTDAGTSEPIENATVTLSRTGERGAELTNSSGVAVLGLDAATWSWIVRAAGYESRTGTVVVSGDAALSVEMDGIIQPEPPEPAEAPLCAVTLPVINQYGIRLSGVSVGFKFAGLQPNADPGAVIMSPPPPQVSDGNGVVQVNLIRLARYTATYKIEGETRNIAIAVPDEGSFIVVDT